MIASRHTSIDWERLCVVYLGLAAMLVIVTLLALNVEYGVVAHVPNYPILGSQEFWDAWSFGPR